MPVPDRRCAARSQRPDSHEGQGGGVTGTGDQLLPGAISLVDEEGVPVLRLCGEIDSTVVAAYEDATAGQARRRRSSTPRASPSSTAAGWACWSAAPRTPAAPASGPSCAGPPGSSAGWSTSPAPGACSPSRSDRPHSRVASSRTALSAMITRGRPARPTTVVDRPVDQLAHHVPAAGQQQQRDQRERDAEREHHLREHQRAGRVRARAPGRRGPGPGSARGGRAAGSRRRRKPCMITWPA